MTHFTVGAILPATIAEDMVRSVLDVMLERYNEHREVEEYTTPCYCVGYLARKRGTEMANKLVGTLDALKVQFWESSQAQVIQRNLGISLRLHDDIEAARWYDAQNAAWRAFSAEMTQQWHETYEDYEQYSPDYGKPESTCDACGGTGMRPTTYNPDSRWDWWRIGGRWDGSILDHTPEGNGFNFGGQCETLANNRALIADLLTRPELFTCRALLTPDGEWIERGQMLYWGMSSGDASEADWEVASRTVYEQYSDHCLVVLDMHI